jgi:hypothetical protein
MELAGLHCNPLGKILTPRSSSTNDSPRALTAPQNTSLSAGNPRPWACSALLGLWVPCARPGWLRDRVNCGK